MTVKPKRTFRRGAPHRNSIRAERVKDVLLHGATARTIAALNAPLPEEWKQWQTIPTYRSYATGGKKIVVASMSASIRIFYTVCPITRGKYEGKFACAAFLGVYHPPDMKNFPHNFRYVHTLVFFRAYRTRRAAKEKSERLWHNYKAINWKSVRSGNAAYKKLGKDAQDIQRRWVLDEFHE